MAPTEVVAITIIITAITAVAIIIITLMAATMVAATEATAITAAMVEIITAADTMEVEEIMGTEAHPQILHRHHPPAQRLHQRPVTVTHRQQSLGTGKNRKSRFFNESAFSAFKN